MLDYIFSKLFGKSHPTWNPDITIKNTTPIFLVSGVFLIIVGIIIFILLNDVQEISIDYTHCIAANHTNKTCAEVIGLSTRETCYCKVNFTLDKNITAPVLLYYALTNFYQNYRSYVKSKDHKQLMGELNEEVSDHCYPFDYSKSEVDGKKKPIAPCGAIANSMFNDQLSIVMINSTKGEVVVPLIKKNITWDVLKKNKYRNPPGNLSQAFANFTKPINWTKNIWELDLEDPDNNGFQNEDFIVWMQTAMLSSFKKTYRRVNHSGVFAHGLPQGKYILMVNYSFPTAVFQGTKSLVIANTSMLGTKNYFLAFIYLFNGLLCLVITVAFYIIQFKYDENINA